MFTKKMIITTSNNNINNKKYKQLKNNIIIKNNKIKANKKQVKKYDGKQLTQINNTNYINKQNMFIINRKNRRGRQKFSTNSNSRRLYRPNLINNKVKNI